MPGEWEKRGRVLVLLPRTYLGQLGVVSEKIAIPTFGKVAAFDGIAREETRRVHNRSHWHYSIQGEATVGGSHAEYTLGARGAQYTATTEEQRQALGY